MHCMDGTLSTDAMDGAANSGCTVGRPPTSQSGFGGATRGQPDEHGRPQAEITSSRAPDAAPEVSDTEALVQIPLSANVRFAPAGSTKPEKETLTAAAALLLAMSLVAGGATGTVLLHRRAARRRARPANRP